MFSKHNFTELVHNSPKQHSTKENIGQVERKFTQVAKNEEFGSSEVSYNRLRNRSVSLRKSRRPTLKASQFTELVPEPLVPEVRLPLKRKHSHSVEVEKSLDMQDCLTEKKNYSQDDEDDLKSFDISFEVDYKANMGGFLGNFKAFLSIFTEGFDSPPGKVCLIN